MRKPPGGRTSFDDELYSFERWRSEQGLRSAGLDTRQTRESVPWDTRESVPGERSVSMPRADASAAPPPAANLNGTSAGADSGPVTAAVVDVDQRLSDFEARLRREWETLRDLWEEPLRRLREHYLPMLERFAEASATAPPAPGLNGTSARVDEVGPVTADVVDVDRRLAECEARLRREWETLRKLYEEPLRRLQQRYLPALEHYTEAMADHQRQLADAQLRIDMLEQRVSSEFATATRNLLEVATIIRDLTAIRDRAAEAAPAVAPPDEPPVSPDRAKRRFFALAVGLLNGGVMGVMALTVGLPS